MSSSKVPDQIILNLQIFSFPIYENSRLYPQTYVATSTADDLFFPSNLIW